MKFLKFAGITTIVVGALAVLGVTLAFAQKPTPPDTLSWWKTMSNRMQSSGMMGNGSRGMMGSGMIGGNSQSMQDMHNQMSQNGGMDEMHRQMTENGGMDAMHEWMHQSGGMHDTVWKALADQLGLTPDELTTQVKSGKTLTQIAQEKGISTQDLATSIESSMKTGLAQAVKDGQLTQDQADQMLQHMDGQYEWMINNMSAGMMGTGGGMMSPGTGGCHDNTTVQGTDL